MFDNKTSRWNVKIIYHIVSLASSNTYTDYCSKYRYDKGSIFLDIAMGLAIPHTIREFDKNKTKKKFSFEKDLDNLKNDLQQHGYTNNQNKTISNLLKDIVIDEVNGTIIAPPGQKLYVLRIQPITTKEV